MKKTFTFVLILISSMCLFNAIAVEKPTDSESDKIFFMQQPGGTTRIASTMSLRAAVQPTVVGECKGDIVTLDIQNYVGEVMVEIIGEQGDVAQAYFNVYDMGFNVVNISSLRPGKYIINVITKSNVFVGEFIKKGYGYYK